jgi:hypothetical protein
MLYEMDHQSLSKKGLEKSGNGRAKFDAKSQQVYGFALGAGEFGGVPEMSIRRYPKSAHHCKG